MSFNIFSQPTDNDIKVGYISTERGFIDGVSKREANIYAKSNPGSTFILKTRESIRYLNINEVNSLTIEDLGGNQKSLCEGIQFETECGPPKAYFYGGGGVGVQGNPIVGSDGALLAVDLIRGGHGYQYAPITEVKDGCGIGAGAVIRSVLGDVVERFQIYDQEDDFENYIIESDSSAGFGRRFGADGRSIGEWDPSLYASLSDDPIRREIQQYQNFLQQNSKPWWTTRKEIPLRITATDKVNKVIHKVTDEPYRKFQDAKGPGNLQATIAAGFVWNKFMNRYAVSPVPPSSAPGSDFATELFQMEWEEDFPYDGQYKFRGNGDGAIRDLYIDNQKIMTLSSFNEAPAKTSKYIKAGVHQIRIDLKNGGLYKELVAPARQAQAAVTQEQTVGSIFLKEGGQYFVLIGGNDLVKIRFRLDFDDDPNNAGIAVDNIKVDTEEGILFFDRKKKKERGSVEKFGIFRANKKYKVSINGAASGSKSPVIVNTGPNPNQRQQRINMFDSDGNDVNARFTALTAEQLSGARVVKAAVAAQSARFVTQPSKELFTTTDFISRSNRVLFRTNPSNLYADNNFMNSFGITPVNPNSIETRTQSFVGAYTIKWPQVNFPDKSVYTFEIMADDFATITISGPSQEAIVIEKAGGPRSSKLIVSKTMNKGKYDITVVLEQSDDGPLKDDNVGRVGQQDRNPMGFAMTVLGSIAQSYVLQKQPWNDNPTGVSVTIDAPLPPIPQEPIPAQEGRCPNNPIWTTRFPTSSQRWWPVSWSEALGAFGKDRRFYWTDFFNRYAISPVPPSGELNTDAGGIVFTNSWPVEIPYDGFYKFAVQRDNIAKIFVDGRVAFDLKGSGDIIWKHHRNKVKFQSIFLTRGNHTISLELINANTETFKFVTKKILRSKDFQAPATITETSEKKEVTFSVTTSAEFANRIVISEIGLDEGKSYKGPQLNSNVTKQIEVGKEYSVQIFSPQSKDGIRLQSSGSSIKIEEDDDNDFTDLICTPSEGEFINLNNGSQSASCTFIVKGGKKQNVSGGLSGGASRGGVTYSGPPLFHYKDERWSKFMNNHGVSPLLPPLNADNPAINGTKDYTFSGVDFPLTGQYDIYLQSDNIAEVFVNNVSVAKSRTFKNQPTVQKATISAGKYDVVVKLENVPSDTDIFLRNPTGFGLVIQKQVRVSNGSKSWTQNPVAISAILIPPPCPKLISGKGSIVDVLVDDPGNGYESPAPDLNLNQISTYPVSLRLKSIEVEDTGINYNCGTDEIVIEPSNGAELSYSCDTFGRITNVDIINPGLGFTRYPDIRMVGPNGGAEPTPGVNATFRPQFEVVRDPIVVDEDKLIQVTDLVGLKQTGYIDGRAYFGAVFYKNGVSYAGFYETPGDLVQVYRTLQESIDAQVTTPPSAIQRQGTDVTNNDPRLDIPNTPENLIDND